MKQMFIFFMLLLPFCVKAQLQETFSHVEIASNYPWNGHLERFKTEDGFLRLNDRAQQRDARIYLYGAVLEENEWMFRVKSEYKTTSNNYMKVYLWSRDSTLTNWNTSYYVQLGGGTKQRIMLCKEQNGAVSTLLSKEITNLSDAFDIHVRVLANEEEITLYARSDAKPEYSEIGSVAYEKITTPGYFVLYCKYSSEHAKNKYFGPITINNFLLGKTPEEGGTSENTTGPSLISLIQEDASTLLLSFSEPVYPAYAVFTLSSLGEVDRIEWSYDETQLRLIWKGQMTKGESYQLSYKDLYDARLTAYQSTLPPFVATAEPKEENETEVAPVSPGDVLINEVMANPKGAAGLPETEYVELYNTTDRQISLKGWSFYYADKATPLNFDLPAKGYAVLFREGRDITVDSGGLAISLASFPSALANTGKQLQLQSAEGTLIDDIFYPSSKAGISFERTKDGWVYSSDERGGTPGSENSSTNSGSEEEENNDTVVLPREIVFTELLPEPQQGGSEYIELYNRSERVLPVSGLGVAIRKADGTLNTIYPLSSLTEPLQPGEYRVLTKSKNGVLDYFNVTSPQTIYELKLPILANTSSKLVLFRLADNEVIDEVHYSEKWHSPAIKNKKGIALEKIDLDGDSQDPANWTSAATYSGGGTPGSANSQQHEGEEDIPTGIHAPEFVTQTGMYEIAYQLDRAGYLCRASIFDTSGRKVADIANNELLGIEGKLSWNGFVNGVRKPATGVYIFHAEIYHPQGGRKAYKKVFLVR